MPAPLLKPALAILMAGAGFVLAQDPTRDLPWRRVEPTPSPVACVDRGTQLLDRGWNWEAARVFRELVAHDETRPLGHLGLALALRASPNRAARLFWEAIARKDAATEDERKVIAAYQRYFGVTRQPEFVDPRFEKQPGRERSKALIDELLALDSDLASQFLAVETARMKQSSLSGDFRATLASHHAYLQQRAAMPFLVPGYRELLGLHLANAPEREQQLARLPRHPHFGVGSNAPVDALAGLRGDSPDHWEPSLAPGFDLPRGLGGRGKFADYEGKPLLVVFFLGFG